MAGATRATSKRSSPHIGLRVVIEHDPAADAAWIILRDGTFAETLELDPWRLIDIDADGNPLRIELLTVSRGVDVGGLPEAEQIGNALQEAGIAVRRSVP